MFWDYDLIQIYYKKNRKQNENISVRKYFYKKGVSNIGRRKWEKRKEFKRNKMWFFDTEREFNIRKQEMEKWAFNNCPGKLFGSV